jgi:hypothetical protein
MSHDRAQLPGHELVLTITMSLALTGLARGARQHALKYVLSHGLHTAAAIHNHPAIDVNVV